MAIITLASNPSHAGMLDMRANIPFANPDGEQLALQLIKPRWASGGAGFPLVLFIQGSGWTKPDQFWQLPALSQLAARGFVIASVTHRSCKTAPAPAFLRDVKTALRFLKAHAADYDINKERVCAFGTSSGGNTALLLGLTADDPAFEGEAYAEESTRVQAVVDCFGPAELEGLFDERLAAHEVSDDFLLYMLGGRDLDTCHQVLRTISPAAYVTPGRQLPPFLLLHGDADDVVDFSQSENLYHQLTEQGYQADLVRVTGAPHEGTFWSQPLWETIFGFIQRHV